MLVAELHLYERHVESFCGDEVSCVRAAERVEVEPGREAKFVEQPMENVQQVGAAQDGSCRGWEQVGERSSVAGESALDPVAEDLDRPFPHGENRSRLLCRAAMGFAPADPHHPIVAEIGCLVVSREIDDLKVAQLVRAKPPGVSGLQGDRVTPRAQRAVPAGWVTRFSSVMTWMNTVPNNLAQATDQSYLGLQA
jgi:hypothetical protein